MKIKKKNGTFHAGLRGRYSRLFPCLFLAGGFFFFVNAVGPSGRLTRAQTIQILAEKIAAVGKLPFKQDVPVLYLNKTRFREYLAARFDLQYPRELAGKEEVFLRLMGYVAANEQADVRRIQGRISRANPGGLYNGKTKELVAANAYRDIDYIRAMVLLHELRHALQDQHFDLTALRGGYSDFDDRKLAVLAAIEGDAMFHMLRCSDMDPAVMTSTSEPGALLSFAPIAKPALLHGKPPVFKYRLIMPYVNGLRFVNAIFKKKKQKGVNNILRNPPESSEQVLHPRKYLKKEKPVIVDIRYTPPGSMLYHSGVIGEYYLDVLLKTKTSPELTGCAGGWGGDTFHIYKLSGKQTPFDSYFLVWESLWDEESYCSHFYTDFKRFIGRRFQVYFKDGNVKGTAFSAGRSHTGEGYFFLVKSGNKLVYARSDDRNQMNLFIYGGNYD